MRRGEREALRTRYVFRCGYCGISETDVGSELTIDHFQPRSHGGTSEPDNLVYSCHACNEFKADYWQPQSVQRILHPLLDDVSRHIAERHDGTLQALTETGAFQIHRLRLNRAGLVAHRVERHLNVSAGREQTEIARRVSQLEERMERMAEQVERLARLFLSTE